MEESFWWWQCSDRYIISLFPHLIRPSPVSLMVLWTLSTTQKLSPWVLQWTVGVGPFRPRSEVTVLGWTAKRLKVGNYAHWNTTEKAWHPAVSWYRLLVRGGWLLVYYRVILASTIVFAVQTRGQGQQTLIIMNNNIHLSLYDALINALSAHMIHILCLVTLLWSVEKSWYMFTFVPYSFGICSIFHIHLFGKCSNF